MRKLEKEEEEGEVYVVCRTFPNSPRLFLFVSLTLSDGSGDRFFLFCWQHEHGNEKKVEEMDEAHEGGIQ